MANMASHGATQYYQALVDIGSNGIRFSISDMSPPNSRTMPTIYQDRAGISLYDAQYSSGTKAPISSTVSMEVVTALLRFRSTCHDFGVLDENVKVVATEATRNAINRDDLLGEISNTTGWKVHLLAKEEEGRLGAMGIASSVDLLKGICMDMGGGSVQLTWAVKSPSGDIDMGPSVSFPYGAAALMARIDGGEITRLQDLQREISMKLQGAIEEDLKIPQWLWEEVKRTNGFNLYLSGGGFRGWGHLLMSQERSQPYPIPIINGYSVSKPVLFNTSRPLGVSMSHRISARRASQVPAVQLLLRALDDAQLQVSQATFAQGGVREGLLYDGLSPSLRSQNALVAATLPYAPPSAAALIDQLKSVTPKIFHSPLLTAVVNLLYLHGPISKDIRASAALRSTTTGILASAHGLSHYERAMLALILCERWDADIPNIDTKFLNSMIEMIGPYSSWWATFIGRMAKGVANLYPTGLMSEGGRKVSFDAIFPAADQICWNSPPETPYFQSGSCRITITILSQHSEVEGRVWDWAKDVMKLGKSKNLGKGMLGLNVAVEVVREKTT